jgi:ABC-type antimicrobial peptide transport system ATPase subunit
VVIGFLFRKVRRTLRTRRIASQFFERPRGYQTPRRRIGEVSEKPLRREVRLGAELRPRKVHKNLEEEKNASAFFDPIPTFSRTFPCTPTSAGPLQRGCIALVFSSRPLIFPDIR